jgi:hypothetical protein
MRQQEAIIKSARIWIRYGVVSPLLFIAFSWCAYHFDIIHVNLLLLAGASVAIITCFVWWFWALRVIIDLSAITGNAQNALTDIKNLVIMTNNEVKEQRNLYDVLKREIKEGKISKKD